MVCRMSFSEGAETQTFTSATFFHLNFSVPLAMTTVHICIYICDSAKAILFLSLSLFFFCLLGAAYQLLFPTRHKS